MDEENPPAELAASREAGESVEGFARVDGVEHQSGALGRFEHGLALCVVGLGIGGTFESVVHLPRGRAVESVSPLRCALPSVGDEAVDAPREGGRVIADGHDVNRFGHPMGAGA